MKLVNILARDWATWPYDHAAFVSQDTDRDTAAFAIGDQRVNGNGNWNGDSYISGSLIPLKELADDHLVAIVTYGEWEIARESATDGWNGEGLPPVGSDVEFLSTDDGEYWCEAKVKFIGTHWILVGYSHPIHGAQEAGVNFVKAGDDLSSRLRPIRTPEQIAAEERKRITDDIQRVCTDGENNGVPFHEALYQAGYRKTDVQ